MPEKWTGTLVGKMHVEGVSNSDLAKELDVTQNYVSMILHGKRTPPGAKDRLNEALNAVIQKRKG